MLLLNMDDLSAFCSMCNMFKKPTGILSTFYTVDTKNIAKYYQIFMELFENFIPELHGHVKILGITPEFYLYEWFLSLFSKPLNIEMAHRVWDLFFLFGDVVLFKVALAILQYFEKRLCGVGFEGTFNLTHRMHYGNSQASVQNI